MAELIIVSDKRECHENCTKCTVCTARFVNKDALLEEWNRQSSRGHYEFDQTIIEFPTTTEAEIRNKAIDDFFDELQKYEKDDWLKLKMLSIYHIAEQLKEESE